MFDPAKQSRTKSPSLLNTSIHFLGISLGNGFCELPFLLEATGVSIKLCSYFISLGYFTNGCNAKTSMVSTE